jgi:hypothetical protein
LEVIDFKKLPDELEYWKTPGMMPHATIFGVSNAPFETIA